MVNFNYKYHPEKPKGEKWKFWLNIPLHSKVYFSAKLSKLGLLFVIGTEGFNSKGDRLDKIVPVFIRRNEVYYQHINSVKNA